MNARKKKKNKTIMNIHLATQCFQSTIPLFSDQ